MHKVVCTIGLTDMGRDNSFYFNVQEVTEAIQKAHALFCERKLQKSPFRVAKIDYPNRKLSFVRECAHEVIRQTKCRLCGKTYLYAIEGMMQSIDCTAGCIMMRVSAELVVLWLFCIPIDCLYVVQTKKVSISAVLT